MRGVSDKQIAGAIAELLRRTDDLSARLQGAGNAIAWCLRELKHPNFQSESPIEQPAAPSQLALPPSAGQIVLTDGK